MTTVFRALCAELVELDQAEPGDYVNWRQSWNAAITRTRAALAQPEPGIYATIAAALRAAADQVIDGRCQNESEKRIYDRLHRIAAELDPT
jgi:hypothetical protein